MSQNFYLGPGYFFMLCRNFGKRFFLYYLRFMSYKGIHQKMRHASLEKNVIKVFLKFHILFQYGK